MQPAVVKTRAIVIGIQKILGPAHGDEVVAAVADHLQPRPHINPERAEGSVEICARITAGSLHARVSKAAVEFDQRRPPNARVWFLPSLARIGWTNDGGRCGLRLSSGRLRRCG